MQKSPLLRRDVLLAALACASLSLPAAALYESPVTAPVSQRQPAPAEQPASVAAPAPPAPAAPADNGASAFILDPGHGGDDLGAVVRGLREKDIALAIARKVKERLAADGLAARLTRDSDFFIPLNERVLENELGEAFISLHLNEVRGKKAQGITVYAFGKDHLRIRRHHHRRRKVPPMPAPPKEEAHASAALADTIVRSLRSQGFHVDPPARAAFYVLKNPAIPSVLIEMGYLSNPQEAARLDDPAYQEKLADAIASSLKSYWVESGSREPGGETTAAKSATKGK